MNVPTNLQIPVQPLTAEAFAPFGQVIDMYSGARRNHVATAYERTAEAVEPRLWVATIAQATTLPLNVVAMERHPFSAQSFLPVNDASYLVVVCQSNSADQPDTATLKAFRAGPGQGVTYARNVWHHGLAVFEAPAQFVVCMSFTAEGGDDVFVPVEVPVRLVAETIE